MGLFSNAGVLRRVSTACGGGGGGGHNQTSYLSGASCPSASPAPCGWSACTPPSSGTSPAPACSAPCPALPPLGNAEEEEEEEDEHKVRWGTMLYLNKAPVSHTQTETQTHRQRHRHTDRQTDRHKLSFATFNNGHTLEEKTCYPNR